MLKNKIFALCLLLSIFAILCSCGSSSQVKKEEPPAPKTQHEGKWSGTDPKGNKIVLKIDEDGTGDVFINGASVKSQLNAATCLYIVDYKANPPTIQFVFMTRYFDVTEMYFVIDFLGPKMARVWSNFNEKIPSIDEGEFVMKRSF